MNQYSPLPLTLERLWQFSLQHYSVRDIKEACLHLQNHHQGNVNLILLLKWLDEHELAFSEDQWIQLETAIDRTQSLLSQFRYYRRKAKPHLPDTLYRESLQFELQLERQQQSDLVTCLNQLTLTPQQGIPMTHQYCLKQDAKHLCEHFYATASRR
ncbi:MULTISPECIES: TIGR02444 family protein [Vibrio]|uniref:TIGR02444 family protein n=1 Tax=Vibrio TaxID=662 RepID=UPI000B5C40E7|nr:MULTISPECIES: TIGR02444 family protein [Vibrio]HBV76090.1 TIGR02444 family protein [Vibrio sp.]